MNMESYFSRRHNGASRGADQERLAKGLGWFSIGLGAAELLMPGGLAEIIGIRNRDENRKLLRSYGLREIAVGVGILTQPHPAGWLWGRVAGDLLDLASLTSALTSGGSNRLKLATATAAILGVTALDVFCGTRLSSDGNPPAKRRSGPVSYSLLINRPPEEIYGFWRDLQNLPRFMSWLVSVESTGDKRSHWKAKGPGNLQVEWHAELVDDHPNELIRWRSVDGSDLRIAGRVRFERAPGGRGTFVRQELQYIPPGGAISQKLAEIFGKMPLRTVLENDLRRLKQIIETGEIVKSDASIHPGMHVAQPPSSEEVRQGALESLKPSMA